MTELRNYLKTFRSTLLLPILPIVFLTGCSTVHSKVVRVHKIKEYKGKSVFFKTRKKDDLNEIQFKHQILKELLSKGITATESKEKANWLVYFETQSAKVGEHSFSSPLVGTEPPPKDVEISTNDRPDIEGRPHYKDDPLPGQGVIGSTTGSQRTFKKYVEVRIVDLDAFRSNDYSPVIFEARGSIESSHPKVGDVSKCIIQTIFENFPGPQTQELESNKPYPCR